MKYKILFVDDEVKILDSIKRVFIDKNYELLFASNGKEGLKVLEKNDPAVIVTDLRMPEMDGIAFLENAKKIKPNSYRIVLTALSDKENVIKASQNGEIWKYIIKPWDEENLINTISMAIDNFERRIKKKNIVNKTWAESKKIFFLNPHSIIKENIIIDLIMNGFESYYTNDYKKILNILQKYNDSIFFINMDSQLDREINLKIIKRLMANYGTKNIKIGILTHFETDKIKMKYLQNIKLNYEIIQLKSGIEDSKKILLDFLIKNNAKGSRNHVRVSCRDDNNITLNIKYNRQLFNGIILDISPVAMACKIIEAGFLLKNQSLRNIQLVLKGHLVLVDGVIKLIKEFRGENIYIIHFQQPSNEKINENICKFLHQELQDKFNSMKI